MLNKLVIGGMNRITAVVESPSGKGYNVARGVSRLGVPACAAGTMFRSNGELIMQALKDDKVDAQLTMLPGRVRTNMKILDESRREVTEINEPGTAIDQQVIDEITQQILSLCKRSKYMVFSGSIPRGTDPSIYKQMIQAVNSTGCKAVLDSEGLPFTLGIQAKPYMIKPNLYELELLVGHELRELDEILLHARDIIREGVEVVLVSMGSRGAVLVQKDSAWYTPAPIVEVASTVGAGDCMLSGALYALYNSMLPMQVMRYATAAAASCVMQNGAELLNAAQTQSLLDTITVKQV